MVNQRNLGRILFSIKEVNNGPLPEPEPIEDATPLEISMLGTILLPVFENGLVYYFVNDKKADDEHKKFYRIKDFPAKGSGLEYVLSYKEYYYLNLNNFIIELEESEQKVEYTFTITDYTCYFKNVVVGQITDGTDEINYYQANYSNYGYKSNNIILDENNGTIHHVRFITTPTEETPDYDPTYDAYNVYEVLTHDITFGDYEYGVVDDGIERKLIIYFDTSKGQTEESAKNANVKIFVKNTSINDLSDSLPEKGTSEYYYMFYAYEIEYKNILDKNNENNSSNTESSNTESSNTESSNTEPSNTEPSNTEPSNTDTTNTELTEP